MYTNLFNSKALQKFTQIGIFGFKMYHLATLPRNAPDGLAGFFDAGRALTG
jgi:hypothetical protein